MGSGLAAPEANATYIGSKLAAPGANVNCIGTEPVGPLCYSSTFTSR